MPKQNRHTFVISAKMAEHRFQGFIDMLRYDAAKVIEGSSSMLVLQTVGHEPTEGRWASFGLHVLARAKGNYPDIPFLKDVAKERLPL
jgi:hypothetical protein